MACFHPLTAYRAPPGYQFSKTNSSGFSFDPRSENISGVEKISIPCGQCLGCRLERSRQWAMRIVLEKQLHEESCFITLTYDDDHLPKGKTLFQEDVTLFLKRLRKWLWKNEKKHIRYFYCGEYGAKTKRPHYHLCLFGYEFKKYRKFYKFNGNGDSLWTCEELEKIWGKGYCPFGSLTFDSAAYTARYILKKVNGDIAEEHYQGRKAEFICMSRMPGIGADWLKKYGSDLYAKDYIHLRNGLKARPPKYFDRLFEAMHLPPKTKNEYGLTVRLIPSDFVPDDEYQRFLDLKKRRQEYAINNPENSPSRLKQREEVARLKSNTIYKRRLEESVV